MRRNSARTRNARLAAIHSFMHYAAVRDPASLPITTRVLAIPSKRFDRPVLGHLTQEQIAAILARPRPDHVERATATLSCSPSPTTPAPASRSSPHSRVGDVLVDRQAAVHLRGKGRKERVIPLWTNTAAELRAWLNKINTAPEAPVFPNRNGTRDVTFRSAGPAHTGPSTTAERTAHRCTASPSHPTRSVTRPPSTYSKSGVDLAVIALWLGHSSPAVTHQYLEADLATKEATLERLADQSRRPRSVPTARPAPSVPRTAVIMRSLRQSNTPPSTTPRPSSLRITASWAE